MPTTGNRMTPMMDWDRVRVFHAVAQAGSFTRAAEGLGLSQSAISRQIGALEEDLGTPLFHRHARGLVLTEQGEILLHTANEVAKRMASVQTALGDSRDSPAGHLRINATIGLGSVWLVAQLPDFIERHPDITISLVIGDSDVDLSMREADVAIRVARPTQPDLIQRHTGAVEEIGGQFQAEAAVHDWSIAQRGIRPNANFRQAAPGMSRVHECHSWKCQITFNPFFIRDISIGTLAADESGSR